MRAGHLTAVAFVLLLPFVAWADQNTVATLITAQSGQSIMQEIYDRLVGQVTSSELQKASQPPGVLITELNCNYYPDTNTVEIIFKVVSNTDRNVSVVYNAVQLSPPYDYYQSYETVATNIRVVKRFTVGFVPDKIFILVIGGGSVASEVSETPIRVTLPSWIVGTNVIPVTIDGESIRLQVIVKNGYAYPVVVAPATTYVIHAGGKEVEIQVVVA